MNLSDYIYILFKWKRIIFLAVFLAVVLFTIYSFLIPEKFKATATVMIPPDNSFGLSGLSSLVSDGAGGLGAKLFGMKGSSEDLIFGILNSKSVLTKVIKKFNLDNYYVHEDGNLDKTIKDFRGDLIFELNEYGLIEVSVINESPELSAELVNYFIILSDSMNVALAINQAKNNRTFIETRYFKNVTDLKLAEDSLYKIQKKYGVFAIPEQLEVSIKAAAEMETQLYQREMETEIIKKQFGPESPQYSILEDQLKTLSSRVQELKNPSKLTSSSNVLFPFNEIPEMSLDYYRTYREVEIQSRILEFILPMYEQAKVEEQKNMPTLMIVDQATPPQLKYSPKKAFIILFGFFLSLFFTIPLVFRFEKILALNSFRNPLEKNEFMFYKKIENIFRIR